MLSFLQRKPMTREEVDNFERGEQEIATEFPPKDFVRLELQINNGRIVARPDFFEHATVLHPIPNSLQQAASQLFSIGDFIGGRLGFARSIGKTDKDGRPLYVQHFIPRGLDNNDRIERVA